MQVSRLSELGPRSVWDILDDSFDLYRERWVLMCGASAVVYVPMYGLYFALLAGPLARFARAAESNADASAMFGAMGPLFGTIALLLPLNMIAQSLQTGATSVIVRDALTERRITTFREAYSVVLRRFWPLLLGAILYGLAIWVGLCGLFIGALFVAAVLMFVPQLIVLEGRGVGDAFRRSQTLAMPDWGRVLGLIVVVASVSWLLQLGLTAILESVYALIPDKGDAGAQAVQQSLISQALSSVATLLLAPVGAIASTLLYYDVRVRREGFDLVAQAEAMGYPLAPDPFGDVSSEQVRQRIASNQRRGGRG